MQSLNLMPYAWLGIPRWDRGVLGMGTKIHAIRVYEAGRDAIEIDILN